MSLQRFLAMNNYTPFFTLDNNYNPVSDNLSQLLSLQVAGIITVASSLLPDNMDIPVVSYYYDDPRFDSVCPNVEQDSQLIIEHLNAYGHKKIGYLGTLLDQRLKYISLEAERRGLEFPECWRVDSSACENLEPYIESLLKLKEEKNQPKALIFHNDALALKLMRCMRKYNILIPQDFSIIGHNNIVMCENTTPALTSVSFGAIDDIAKVMVELLMEQVKNPERPRKKVLLKSKLTIRESIMNLNIS